MPILSKPRRQRTAVVVQLHPQAPRPSSTNEPAAGAAVVDYPRRLRWCDCADKLCIHERRRHKFLGRQSEIRNLAREVGLRDGSISPEPPPMPHYSHGMAMEGGWTFCQTYDIRCHCAPHAADACLQNRGRVP